MSIAAKYATKSTMIKKHGAIIVYKNKIIGAGYNYLIHPIQKKISHICSENHIIYSIHAEHSAIINAIYNGYKNYLRYSKLYIVRIKDNIYRQSIPCDKCKNIIEKYGIGNVYFSINK